LASFLESFIVALVLAGVLMLVGHLSLAEKRGRRRALSAAAGGSVAYIFIALLPEIEAVKEVFRVRPGETTGPLGELHYGISTMENRRQKRQPGNKHFLFAAGCQL
jgi:hypothetical protein